MNIYHVKFVTGEEATVRAEKFPEAIELARAVCHVGPKVKIRWCRNLGSV